MLAAPFLLAACQQAEPPANDVAAPAPKAAAADGDVSTAERLVRQRLGTTGEIRFSDARRSASEGVPIVCGQYEQSGVHQRYLVVNGEEVFVEPGMRAGEMDRAFAEFCGEGGDNRPAPVIGREGNGL